MQKLQEEQGKWQREARYENEDKDKFEEEELGGVEEKEKVDVDGKEDKCEEEKEGELSLMRLGLCLLIMWATTG